MPDPAPGAMTQFVPDLLAVIPVLPAVPSLLTLGVFLITGIVSFVWALRHPAARRMLRQTLWSQRWSLLILCGFALALVPLWARMTDERAPISVPRVLPRGEWDVRGGDARTGNTAGSTPSFRVPPQIRWVGGTGHTFLASPALVGERVYGIGFRGDRGRVFCWDMREGRQLWTSAVPGFRATFSSPVIQGTRLIVGEGLHRTPDASVFCLDLDAGSEGRLLGQFRTHSHVECTPVTDGENVFITAGDDGIYSLRFDPSGGLRLNWHVPGESAPDVETSLGLHDGRLFVGLGQGGHAVLVLDAATGRELARLPMPAPVHGIPAFWQGRLYLGMGHGDYIHHEQTRGQVVCIDLETLQVEWEFATEGTVLGAVACDDRGCVFACTGGTVYSLNHGGEARSIRKMGSPVLASPAVTEEQVLVVEKAGSLIALDRFELKHLWNVKLGTPGLYVSAPVVAQDRIFVGTPDSGFVCLTGGDDHESGGPLPLRAEVLWEYPLEGRIAAAPGVTPSMLVVPVLVNDKMQLVGLERTTADLQKPRLQWIHRTSTPGFASVRTRGEIAVISMGQRLSAFDAPTGKLLWQSAAPSGGIPIIEGLRVRMKATHSTRAEGVTVSLLDGSPLERDGREAEPRQSRKQLELRIEGRQLLWHDPLTGSEHLCCDLSQWGEILCEPVVAGSHVFVSMEAGRLLCLGRREER